MSERKSITINSPLSDLKGVGEKTAQLFASKGIRTVGDLLNFYPRDYDWFTEPVTVDQLKPGEMAAVTLTIVGNGSTVHAGGYQITNFHAADATGQIRLTYFNMPYLLRTIRAGSIHVFRGMVRQYKNGNLQIEQASAYTPAEYAALKSTFQPRYSLTKGMKNSQVIRLMHRALEECRLPEDYIPEADRKRLGGGVRNSKERSCNEHNVNSISADHFLTSCNSAPSGNSSVAHLNAALMEEREATLRIHFPRNAEEMVRARNRKIFDEFFAFILAMKRQKAEEQAAHNDRPMVRVADTERLMEELPYELTDSQKQAWEEIQDDLSGDTVMNRLLQGDVGSGKTILAFLSLIMCAANGHQGALMAPTEVLAEQHRKDLSDMVERYHLHLHPVLLTGSVKGKTRREVLAAIADGSADVVIGTHALIQEQVVYHDLDLVITDEQHRFGVRQREALARKGESSTGTNPHAETSEAGKNIGTYDSDRAAVPVLVMSATPIPRTLSIILYGDLSVSRLTDMPKNRLPIKNLAISESERGRVYKFILKQIAEGHQVYVICPAIEEHEEEEEGGPGFLSGMRGEYGTNTDIQNVKDYTEKIRRILPESVRIESLNGKMKPAEKERIMTAFGNHDIDILVSTTVIEVGINVPNATVMLIENAERFGLSQLHQLRGRVGRGQWQSYCIFMYSEKDLHESGAAPLEKSENPPGSGVPGGADADGTGKGHPPVQGAEADSKSGVPKRLQILTKTNNGFDIAEEDLKLRGPGDLFGVRQSGEMGFRLADIYEDAGMLTKASRYVDEVLAKNSPPETESGASMYDHLPQIDFRSI